MKRATRVVIAGLVLASLSAVSAFAQSAIGVAGGGSLVIKPLGEKKVAELPAGPLFWRVESFPTLEQARAAAGSLGLAAESGGKAWLFTLGPAGGSSHGGTKVTEIGPVAQFKATQYLLRVNEASGPPGAVTPVHTHPGAEAAYVLAGEQTFRTPNGVHRIGAGQSLAGHPETAMQVSSSGSVDLRALVMFVVDATKPFSTPAKLP
jgi:quercetin dioxygenase-like cupin family protein